MKTEKVVLRPIEVKHATIFIEGDTDLVLNQMNARNTRTLTDKQSGIKTTSANPNKWEDIITAVKWYDGHGMKDSYKESSEEKMRELILTNKPCITAFGLKKSFCQAVVRNEIDTYGTKFDNAVNIIASKGLVPITFTEWSIDERLMSPKKGAPVLVYLNHFTGWKAQFDIAYTDNVYTLDQIVNIIKLAGFGLGIGSGRTSGYGRYHITDVK